MKKFLNEFKAFAMRGNVFDMAIGVVLATAFGKITTSLVADVFMPLIGYFLGASFQNYNEAVDHWVAFILLAIIGGNMLKEAFDRSCGLEDCGCEDVKIEAFEIAPKAFYAWIYIVCTFVLISIAGFFFFLALFCSFLIVRIEIAKYALLLADSSSLLFNFLCRQRKLQRKRIALEKGLLSTAITQFLFQRRWLLR